MVPSKSSRGESRRPTAVGIHRDEVLGWRRSGGEPQPTSGRQRARDAHRAAIQLDIIAKDGQVVLNRAGAILAILRIERRHSAKQI